MVSLKQSYFLEVSEFGFDNNRLTSVQNYRTGGRKIDLTVTSEKQVRNLIFKRAGKETNAVLAKCFLGIFPQNYLILKN